MTAAAAAPTRYFMSCCFSHCDSKLFIYSLRSSFPQLGWMTTPVSRWPATPSYCTSPATQARCGGTWPHCFEHTKSRDSLFLTISRTRSTLNAAFSFVVDLRYSRMRGSSPFSLSSQQTFGRPLLQETPPPDITWKPEDEALESLPPAVGVAKPATDGSLSQLAAIMSPTVIRGQNVVGQRWSSAGRRRASATAAASHRFYPAPGLPVCVLSPEQANVVISTGTIVGPMPAEAPGFWNVAPSRTAAGDAVDTDKERLLHVHHELLRARNYQAGLAGLTCHESASSRANRLAQRFNQLRAELQQP